MEKPTGKCGIACGSCKNFNNGCLGCDIENLRQEVCIIFSCARKKNVSCCLQCNEFPCSLMRGLSKSYCPVFPLIKFDF